MSSVTSDEQDQRSCDGASQASAAVGDEDLIAVGEETVQTDTTSNINTMEGGKDDVQQLIYTPAARKAQLEAEKNANFDQSLLAARSSKTGSVSVNTARGNYLARRKAADAGASAHGQVERDTSAGHREDSETPQEDPERGRGRQRLAKLAAKTGRPMPPIFVEEEKNNDVMGPPAVMAGDEEDVGSPILSTAALDQDEEDVDVPPPPLLLEATRVEEGDNNGNNTSQVSLVHAEPLNEGDSQRDARYTRRGWVVVSVMACAFMVSIVAAVLGTLWATSSRTGGGGAEQPTTSAPSNGPTLGPTSSAPSESPTTQNPSSAATTWFNDTFLPMFTLETIENDPTSPQATARAWLEDHPGLANMSDWQKQQAFAMATFHFATGGPTGWDSVAQDDWLDWSVPECSWPTKDTGWCNEGGKIEGISLGGRGLRGTIPPEISLLTALTHLRLWRNGDLTGTVPTEIGLMTSLIYLGLYDDELSGTLPTQLGLLTSVNNATFRDNKIVGTLPSEIGLMTALEKLSLFNNVGLTGSLPTQLGLLTSLGWLYSWETAFSGQLPSEQGMMTALTELKLPNNALSGSLPSELGLMTSLRSLDMPGNSFSGTIPSELGLLTALTELELRWNPLSGSIPAELCEIFAAELAWVDCDGVDCNSC